MTRFFYASVVPMRLSAKPRMDRVGKNLIISEIKTLLSKQERILFAYLHGSFTRDGPFRHIDVAIYLDPSGFSSSDDILEHGLALGAAFDMSISGATTDIRPLNLAPLLFKFALVTEGSLILTKDEEKRADF
ncbi:MAG: nucleotidyltransferase domain-containing protein [Proteobacteria bacterium]|nr:nucleotidyltransferase domain-containing protein [Pseudomonadota bacterium]NIS70306.1 nucleotidyltransferase domain-containing protein [Pseudomonadota bacterium]